MELNLFIGNDAAQASLGARVLVSTCFVHTLDGDHHVISSVTRVCPVDSSDSERHIRFRLDIVRRYCEKFPDLSGSLALSEIHKK